MKFYIVDAFTDELFGGNPAGVVIIDRDEYPSPETMIKTAAELRYSETVFARKVKYAATNEADSDVPVWELRYFTPTDEVDLCGHATIAAFSVIGEAGKSYKAVTNAGEIGIEVSDDLIMMDMATPEIIEEIDNEMKWEATRKILGLKPEDSFGTGAVSGITPAKVSTGLPDILVPVDSLDELAAITPDFDAMEKLSERQKVVGIHAYALTESKNHKDTVADSGSNDNSTAANRGQLKIDCRNFAPLYGIPEEAATGTANGALAYYLYKKDTIKEGEMISITQGTSMGRPSKIVATVRKVEGACKDNDTAEVVVKVGGSATTLSAGDIYI